MSTYLVVIEHEANSWGAYCPDLPGLEVTAETREEVERLIRQAIPFHLEALREGRGRSTSSICWLRWTPCVGGRSQALSTGGERGHRDLRW
jgi:predicted RNase H-like HicB family nuclease